MWKLGALLAVIGWLFYLPAAAAEKAARSCISRYDRSDDRYRSCLGDTSTASSSMPPEETQSCSLRFDRADDRYWSCLGVRGTVVAKPAGGIAASNQPAVSEAASCGSRFDRSDDRYWVCLERPSGKEVARTTTASTTPGQNIRQPKNGLLRGGTRLKPLRPIR